MGYTVARVRVAARSPPRWKASGAPSCPPALPRTSRVLFPHLAAVWWEEFGGGRELILLSVRRDGEPGGRRAADARGRTIRFAGDTEICDYMDFVAAAGERRPSSRRRPPQPERGAVGRAGAVGACPKALPPCARCQSAAPGFGLRVNIESEDVCPQLELPADLGRVPGERWTRRTGTSCAASCGSSPQGGSCSWRLSASPSPSQGAPGRLPAPVPHKPHGQGGVHDGADGAVLPGDRRRPGGGGTAGALSSSPWAASARPASSASTTEASPCSTTAATTPPTPTSPSGCSPRRWPWRRRSSRASAGSISCAGASPTSTTSAPRTSPSIAARFAGIDGCIII